MSGIKLNQKPVVNQDAASLLKKELGGGQTSTKEPVTEQEIEAIAPRPVNVKQVQKADTGPIENKLDAEINAFAERAQKVADKEKVPGKDYAIFISQWPALTVHIEIEGASSYDRNGQKARTSTPVTFNNGFFKTDDPKVIAGLRVQAERGKQFFREEKDVKLAAIMFEGHKARKNVNSANAGITTSNDGDLSQMVNAEAHLRKMHEDVYNSNV